MRAVCFVLMLFLIQLSQIGMIVTAANPQPVYTGLSFPVSFKFAPDGRIFFNEKNTGKVRIIQNGVLQSTPFASLNVSNNGEQGLLGLALHPSFSVNGYVYVYSTYFNGSYYHGRITRFTAVGNTGTNPLEIFDVTDPTPQTTNHNGGYLKFGPDGKLYAQVGEFAVPSLSQNLTYNAGKVLRMNPDGSAPSDNPFPGKLIYAYGIRNAFGMDFDPFTGKLIATEAGPNINDEINFIHAGGNYGWPNVTGVSNNPAFVDPILTFTPTTTPTGIAYTDQQNILYFGEYNTGNLKRLALTPSGTVASVMVIATVGSSFNGILALETSPSGDIYFSTPTTIYKLPSTPALPFSSISNSVFGSTPNSVYFVIPDYDGPLHQSAAKCGGVLNAALSDFTGTGVLLGMLSNTQKQILDTNTPTINQTGPACGQPNPSVVTGPVVAFGGPLVNEVTHYYEIVEEDSPVYYSFTTVPNGSRIDQFKDRSGQVVAQLSRDLINTAKTDLFVIQSFTDVNGRSIYLFYGFAWKGSFASASYLKFNIYPSLTSFTGTYYIYRWIDATSGPSANELPDPGDTYILIAQG